MLCIEPKGGIDRNFMEVEAGVYIGAGMFEHIAETLVPVLLVSLFIVILPH